MKKPNTLNIIGIILILSCVLAVAFICMIIGTYERLFGEVPPESKDYAGEESTSSPIESPTASSDLSDITSIDKTTAEIEPSSSSDSPTRGEDDTPSNQIPDSSKSEAIQTTSNNTAAPDIQKPKKYIALTFDDGPHSVYTYELLSVLKKYNVKATFFILGRNANSADGRKALKAVYDAGHEIGNHSYSHPTIPNTEVSEVLLDFKKTSDLIHEVCKIRPKVARTPGGKWSEQLLAAIEYPLVNWTVDTRDWEHNSPNQSLEYLKEQARDGGIVIMHDRRSNVAETTELLIKWLHENGYEIVSVSELMSIKNVDFKSGLVYRSTYSIKGG